MESTGGVWALKEGSEREAGLNPEVKGELCAEEERAYQSLHVGGVSS